MEILKTIPELTRSYNVRCIKLMIEDNKAIVVLMSDRWEKKEVDLKPILTDFSKSNKTVIKNFIVKIIATSLDVSIGEIPDTLFAE